MDRGTIAVLALGFFLVFVLIADSIAIERMRQNLRKEREKLGHHYE